MLSTELEVQNFETELFKTTKCDRNQRMCSCYRFFWSDRSLLCEHFRSECNEHHTGKL